MTKAINATKQPPSGGTEILSLAETAVYMGVPEPTLRLRVRAREILPDGRLNSHRGWYFSKARIDSGFAAPPIVLYNVDQLAGALGVHPKTVEGWVRDGKVRPDGVLTNGKPGAQGGVKYWTVKSLVALQNKRAAGIAKAKADKKVINA